jgi:hypothetical protein
MLSKSPPGSSADCFSVSMEQSPLRFCVRKVKHSRSVDPKRGGPELGPDEALVTGTIMSGFVCEGDELAIAPLGPLPSPPTGPQPVPFYLLIYGFVSRNHRCEGCADQTGP